MPVTSDKPAPYTGSISILSLIDRYRNRGMQKPINGEVLGRSGIPDSLIARTLQALQVLDLIDDEGNPTEVLEGLRLSPESEYQQNMQAWLKGSYSDIFLYADPTIDDEGKIRDAFRSYKPVGQQTRMVSLYIGLCSAAGLRPDSGDGDKPRPTSKPRANKQRASTSKQKTGKKGALPETSLHGVPSALSGLMQSLPPEGSGWTQEKRDKFHDTFGTVLDFCFPITEQEPESTAESEED